MNNLISIGKLSEIAGVSIRTIRYYEEVGLFKPAQIAESNYRFYGKDEITKLKLILLLKKIGFSLHEIKSIISSKDNAVFIEKVENKQAQIMTEISGLTCIKEFLDEFVLNVKSDGLKQKNAVQTLIELNSSKLEGLNMVNHEILPIKVIGIGGGCIHAINKMLEESLKMDFIYVDTDKQTLLKAKAYRKIQIGEEYTKGFGTGGDYYVGEKSVKECEDLIKEALKGSDLVFITTCMGGGTGSAGAPVIANIARQMGILTAGIVTSPSVLGSEVVLKNAERSIEELRKNVDLLLEIPTDTIHKITVNAASAVAVYEELNKLMRHSIQCISDLILSSVSAMDFEDVKFLMRNNGMAYLGVGHASGENRAERAVKEVLSSPMLQNNISTASGIILNITGSSSITLSEVNLIAEHIHKGANPDINMIFGAVINEKVKDEIIITAIATGCNEY